MEGIRVRGNGLGGAFFGGEYGSPVAINLPGLPARIHGTPIVPLLLRCGYSVFQPQYFGTYDSDGTFDPRMAYETVRAASEFLTSGEFRDPWTKDELVPRNVSMPLLVAHSFGTYAAMCALISGLTFDRVAMFSPMLRLGCHSREDGLVLDLYRHAERIATVYPFTHRSPGVSDLVRFFTEDRVTWPIPSLTGGGHRPAFGVFAGGSDESLNAKRALEASRTMIEDTFGGELDVALIVPGGMHGVDTLLENDNDGIIGGFLEERS